MSEALRDGSRIARIEFPYKLELRDYQIGPWKAMIHDRKKRGVLCIPRRNGKDVLSLNIAVALSQIRVGLVFYMAPFYNQARSIIWNGTDGSGRRFIDYIPPQLIKKKNDTDMRIDFMNGSTLKLCGSDNIDSIVGNNPVGIVMTEFSLHKPGAWDYMRPVLSENGGWALFNGTPRGLNHFYTILESAKENPQDWYFQHLTRDDTGIPTLEAIDVERKSAMPESLIQQEYYCSFTSSSSDTIIPLDIVEAAIKTVLTHEDFELESRVMGVDVAFSATGDEATIARRQGRMLHPVEAHVGLDNMGLANRVAQHIKTWNPHTVFIDAGRGEGVISRLCQLGYANIIVPVNFGSPAASEIYANKSTEMLFRVRQWLSHIATPTLPPDPRLIKQLTSRLFEQDERRRLKAESKKAMRSRGLESPDRAEAVALTFAEEFYNDAAAPLSDKYGVPLHEIRALQQKTGGESYDPLNYLNSLELSLGVSFSSSDR